MQLPSFESTTTYSQEEFPALVENLERCGFLGHYELIYGKIIVNPPAGWPHGEVSGSAFALLREHARRTTSGRALDSSQGYALPSGDTVEPDASFISNQRWANRPPTAPGEFLKVVPDVLVEVLSLSTSSYDRGKKKAIYEQNGVLEYWLIDWRERTLTAFHLRNGRFEQEGPLSAAVTFRSEALSGLELKVAELFPDE